MAANRANIGWYLDNQIGGEDDRITGRIYEKEVKLTSAEILDLYNTPKQLVVAPGTGKVIELLSAVFFLNFGVQYTGGGALTIRTITAGAAVSEDIAAGDLINHDDDIYRAANSALCADGADVELAANDGLELYNATAVHADGTGTLTVKIMYRIHDFN